jgi:hypothetical protein
MTEDGHMQSHYLEIAVHDHLGQSTTSRDQLPLGHHFGCGLQI